MQNGRRLMQGNEACAEGAIAAGCRFFAGYPITPSTEVAEYLAKRLPEVGGKFIQMEDEIASMAAIIGASLGGLKSMTATSGPGFSLKQENIGYACLTEVPCVVVNVMRAGPSTGLPTSPGQADVMQARWGTHGDHPVIALVPFSVMESFNAAVMAFNFAEKYRTPVILLLDEIIGHMREPIILPDPSEIVVVNRTRPAVKDPHYSPYDHSKCHDCDDIVPLPPFGEGYRYHVTGLSHDYSGFPTSKPSLVQAEEERLLRKIKNNEAEIIKIEKFMLDDAEIAIFAYGSTARSAKAAITTARSEGIKVGLFRPITIWPFPEKEIDQLAGAVRHLVVAEMNLGQMVYEVERCAHGKATLSGVFQANGEPISPEAIYRKIKEAV